VRQDIVTPRTLQRVIPSIPTSDGAGVKLRRSLGQSQDARLNPFLMLDEFSSENADIMNTREEIEQAIRDYQSGRLTTAA
jgi:redox-sensitive bicupin YhaK (pirin superfamily)